MFYELNNNKVNRVNIKKQKTAKNIKKNQFILMKNVSFDCI
jgi:hypothetical protein